MAASTTADDTAKNSSGSSFKDKLHHIGEKLALVPPTDKELSDRLEVAREQGDKDEEKKLLMKRAAAGQNASTDVEEA